MTAKYFSGLLVIALILFLGLHMQVQNPSIGPGTVAWEALKTWRLARPVYFIVFDDGDVWLGDRLRRG